MKDNWKIKNIDTICEILDNQRIPLNAEQRSLIPGSIPYYGANGVQGYISKHLFDDDLILMAEDGGNFEEYATRPIAYKISGKSWVNNHAHILKAKKEFNQNYIFYSLVHKNILPFIKGGTRSKLNLSDLKTIEVAFPPLPQQRKIAEILSTVDAVIVKTEAAIAKYQQLKQGLMHDLFTRGIDAHTGQLRPKQEEAPELYKMSALGWIPKEWEVEELGNLIIGKGDYGINAPAVNFDPKYYTYLRITDISEDGYFIEKGKKSVNHIEARNFILEDGDIVFARTGNSTGKTYLYRRSDGILVFAGFLIRFRPDSTKLNSTFLKFITETPYYKNWVSVYSARTGQPGINGYEYSKLTFVLPSVEEQHHIAKKLNALNEKIQTEQQALAKYQQLKAGLMQDLLTDRVEVSG